MNHVTRIVLASAITMWGIAPGFAAYFENTNEPQPQSRPLQLKVDRGISHSAMRARAYAPNEAPFDRRAYVPAYSVPADAGIGPDFSIDSQR